MKRILTFCLCFLALFSVVVCASSCNDAENNRTQYEINCELNEHVLKATQTVEFFNNSDNVITELKFNLFANAYRKGALYSPVSAQYLSRAYPNGVNYGDIVINSAKVDGKTAEFSIGGVDQNVLIIPLNKSVYPDEKVVVYLDYIVNLANVVSRTGYNSSTINLANFYPILCVFEDGKFYECVYYDVGDPFYSECSDYNVKLTCDDNLVVASSGTLKSEHKKGQKKTSEFTLKNARSFAFVLSENFSVLSKDCLGVKINYYYYDDLEPEKSIDYAVKAIKLFSDKFGKFAYKSLAITQTQFVQGGMEFPALVMISDELTGLPYGEVIVHETAHQWWQSAVGNNEIEHGFLDEGLAEYSVVLFYEKYPEYGYTRQGLIKASEQTYKVFCSVSDKLSGKVNTVMIRSLKDFLSEYEYVNVAYIKPCIMYDNLRTTVGNTRFFNALKRYYEQNKYKNAKPDDLVGAFEKVGAGTNGYFESFFLGKEII